MVDSIEIESLMDDDLIEVDAPQNVNGFSGSGQSVEAENNNVNDINIDGEGGRPRKKRKRRSEVWDHFAETVNTHGKPSATCNYCKNELAAGSSVNGTSSLKKHLASCKKFSGSRRNQSLISLFSASNKDGEQIVTLGKWEGFDSEVAIKSLIEMIILDEDPFNKVEKEGFKRFCRAVLPPTFNLPSRWTVVRMCFNVYVDERIKLQTFFKQTKQRISLTTDTWTSLQKVSYMSLTAHYVDENWVMQKKILNFVPVDSHKGEDLGDVVERCLKDWGINKVYTLTVDNASSNDGVVRVLRNALMKWGTAVRGGQDLHMRCAAHIINLVVGEGSKQVNKSVCSVRGLVKFIRLSPMRIKRFREAAEFEGQNSKKWLCLDVPTRWNSLYMMLNTAEKFEKAFERFKRLDKDVLVDLEGPESTGFPEKEDWINVRKLVKFLSHLFYLTEKVSGSFYTTSNIMFPEIAEVNFKLQEWEKDVQGKVMARKMMEKFVKYWGDPQQMNKNIFHALVLDPRHKMEFLEFLLLKMFGEEKGKEYSEMVSYELKMLFEEYKSTVVVPAAVGGDFLSSQGNPGGSSQGGESRNVSDENMHQLKDAFKLYKSRNGHAEKTELDRYLSDDVEPDNGDFNVLQWWKLHAHRFPVVAAMAKDVLGVPITTVASESAFSTGGRVLDAFRSSLTPRMAQALICAQDWIRGKIKEKSDMEDLDVLHNLEQDFEKLHFDSTIFD